MHIVLPLNELANSPGIFLEEIFQYCVQQFYTISMAFSSELNFYVPALLSVDQKGENHLEQGQNCMVDVQNENVDFEGRGSFGCHMRSSIPGTNSCLLE